jgi:hypothetical protein
MLPTKLCCGGASALGGAYAAVRDLGLDLGRGGRLYLIMC